MEDNGLVSVSARHKDQWVESFRCSLTNDQVLDPSMWEWMKARGYIYSAWRIGAFSGAVMERMVGRKPEKGTNFFFETRDPELMTLFKLTWGGQ
jgi:hypothetical protein